MWQQQQLQLVTATCNTLLPGTDCQGTIKIKLRHGQDARCTMDVDAAAAQFVSLQMDNNCCKVWTQPTPSEAVPLATSHCGGSTWMAACHQMVHNIDMSAKCSWLSLFSSSAVVNSCDAAARSYKHTYHTSTPCLPLYLPLCLLLCLSRLPSNWIMRAAQWRTRCFR